MESHRNTAASMRDGRARRRGPAPTLDGAGDAAAGAVKPAVLEPAQAAMAIISRCANHTLIQQIEQAYIVAMQARDCARVAAAAATTDLPPGPAREALAAAWAGQEERSERLMHAVLRFGREHGHLAFAFPVRG